MLSKNSMSFHIWSFPKVFLDIADDVVKTAAACFTHFGQQGAHAHTPPPEMKQFAGKLHLTNTLLLDL